MPDWSYNTVFKPLLFRMPPAQARDLAMGILGRIARLPLGPSLIAFLGHARPDTRLVVNFQGTHFQTRVGQWSCIDPQGLAWEPLSQFGLGFLEIGPVNTVPTREGTISADEASESVTWSHSPGGCEPDAVKRHLEHRSDCHVLLRLCPQDGNEATFEADAGQVIKQLHGLVTGVVIDGRVVLDDMVIASLSNRARESGVQFVLLALPATRIQQVDAQLKGLFQRGAIQGVVVEGAAITETFVTVGRCHYEDVLAGVQAIRQHLPREAGVIAAGGIHEPWQVLELLKAGSDLVRLDVGIVFSGPGLPKRINDLILFEQMSREVNTTKSRPEPLGRQAWFWTLAIGIAMWIGGVMALVIAATRVIMPYDEAIAGMTVQEIDSFNPKLLHFMQHDRVTLAGTMLAIGILYSALSWRGVRFGMHWAQLAIIASALPGFASFFLFLGFGYFDPFHAFVTSILLTPLLLAMHSELPPAEFAERPEMRNDLAWQLSQWGQLLFLGQGAALAIAGAVISFIGISTVFVREDLEFLQTTPAQLLAAHPRLVPLVAHDRATFGGMLISCGVCVVLSSLWGFRRGNRWLWWALMTAGSVAYFATILVHWHVEYQSLWHLLPAYAGIAFLGLSGGLTYGHLCGHTSPSSSPVIQLS